MSKRLGDAIPKTPLEQRLQALAGQQGHPGLIEVRDVLVMLELRDEHIRNLETMIGEGYVKNRRGLQAGD